MRFGVSLAVSLCRRKVESSRPRSATERGRLTPGAAGWPLANIIILRRIRVRYEQGQLVDNLNQAAIRIR